MPLPVLPARSAMPVLFKVIRLVVSLMLALGVKVAVQVIPPSLLLTGVNVPLVIGRAHV